MLQSSVPVQPHRLPSCLAALRICLTAFTGVGTIIATDAVAGAGLVGFVAASVGVAVGAAAGGLGRFAAAGVRGVAIAANVLNWK